MISDPVLHEQLKQTALDFLEEWIAHLVSLHYTDEQIELETRAFYDRWCV